MFYVDFDELYDEYMSDTSNGPNFQNWLRYQPVKANSGKFTIATKRSKHSTRFANRIQTNAEIADKLIEIMKSLNRKQGTETNVDQLLDLTKDLLENNAKLREQVEDALQDIPN